MELKVFDITGREIASLVNGNYSPGIYSVDFDATTFSSGVYFYILRSEGFTESRKMMLVK